MSSLAIKASRNVVGTTPRSVSGNNASWSVIRREIK